MPIATFHSILASIGLVTTRLSSVHDPILDERHVKVGGDLNPHPMS